MRIGKSKTQMLIFMLAVLVCMVCFTKNSFSQKFERYGDTLIRQGSKIKMSPKGETDTMLVTDPITGKDGLVVSVKCPSPLTINGAKIYDINDVTTNPAFQSKDFTFQDYLMTNLMDELNKLPDGIYYLGLGYIVVGVKGDIVYFQFAGISKKTDYEFANKTPIPEEIKKEIDKKIEQILANAKVKPAQLHGKNVPVLFMDDKLNRPIDVTWHKVTNWP